MNPEALEIFNRILKKDVNSLTPFEIAFLKARRPYLEPFYVDKFSSVLGEKKVKLSYIDLIKKAKSLGFKARVGMKREEIEKMIESKKLL